MIVKLFKILISLPILLVIATGTCVLKILGFLRIKIGGKMEKEIALRMFTFYRDLTDKDAYLIWFGNRPYTGNLINSSPAGFEKRWSNYMAVCLIVSSRLHDSHHSQINVN